MPPTKKSKPTPTNEREAWLQLAGEAMHKYVMPDEMPPTKSGVHDLVEDMGEFVAACADELLDQVDKRYDAKGKRRPDVEEEDEEDEEEGDEHEEDEE